MATDSVLPPDNITFDEYLELDEQTQFRSEYRSGQVFAMSGGTLPHGLLKRRAGDLMQNAFSNCRVVESDIKVYAPAVNESMYPDVLVLCHDPQYYGKGKVVLLNPSLIVEILSPSTREYDLGLKSTFYHTISSIATILFIDSQRQWIQRQTRIKFNWDVEEFTQPEQTVMTVGDRHLSVSIFYDGIEL